MKYNCLLSHLILLICITFIHMWPREREKIKWRDTRCSHIQIIVLYLIIVMKWTKITANNIHVQHHFFYAYSRNVFEKITKNGIIVWREWIFVVRLILINYNVLLYSCYILQSYKLKRIYCKLVVANLHFYSCAFAFMNSFECNKIAIIEWSLNERRFSECQR